MAEQSSVKRPMTSLLTTEFIERILAEAKEVLEKTGIWVDNEECMELLGNGGAKIDRGKKKAFIPRRLVEESLKSVPTSIVMYDRNGNPAMDLGGNNSYFNPLLCATEIWDAEQEQFRMPLTQDAINHVKLVDALGNIDGQYPFGGTDTPKEVWDCHKLFISLRYSTKPVHASIYAKENFQVFKELMITVRGSEQALVDKPLLSLPVCPAPPLKFSDLVCYAIMHGAKNGIPVVLQPIPQPGITAPMTLAGAVVQSIAEDLAGVVISQLAKRGAPIILGITTMVFDMRRNTVLGGAIETAMINVAHVEVVKYLGKVTEVFMGADAKRPDAQAGLESGMGIMLATLAGANLISGAGVLNNVNAQSLEMLVIDNDIRGMVRRLINGVTPIGERLAEDLFTEDLYDGKHFMSSPTTLKWVRKEYFWPSPIVIREDEQKWLAEGAPTVEQRAKEEVKRILTTHKPEPLDNNIDIEIIKIMTEAASKYGMSRLPMTPEII